MDDRNFDEKAALDWIKMIEATQSLNKKTVLAHALEKLTSSASVHNILDIGCGQGRCSEHIPADRSYTGVEPSDFLLARALEIYSDTHRKFVKGSAYALPFADHTFDAAFSVTVWHLLENINLASRELGRVLKRGSPFFVMSAHPEKYDDWKKPYASVKIEGRRLEGQIASPDGTTTADVLFLHSLDDLLTSFGQAKLTVENIEASGPFIYIWGRH